MSNMGLLWELKKIDMKSSFHNANNAVKTNKQTTKKNRQYISYVACFKLKALAKKADPASFLHGPSFCMKRFQAFQTQKLKNQRKVK